jgi:hypothetical protein
MYHQRAVLVGGWQAKHPNRQLPKQTLWQFTYCHWHTKVHAEISRPLCFLAKRQPPSRRSGAMARPKTLREYQESSCCASLLDCHMPQLIVPFIGEKWHKI